jgi:hypothetical protein
MSRLPNYFEQTPEQSAAVAAKRRMEALKALARQLRSRIVARSPEKVKPDK